MKFLIAFVIAIISHCSNVTSEVFDRPCRSLDEYGGVMKYFHAEKYLGKWFEIERYEQQFQVNRDCCFAEYKTNADSSVNVINRSKNITDDSASSWSFAEGIAVVSYPEEHPVRAML